MQVQQINNQNTNTNFEALKKVKIKGSYLKNNPKLCQQMLEKLNSSESFQNFVNKHDVRVILKSHSKIDFSKSQFYKIITTKFSYDRVPDETVTIGDKLGNMLIGPYKYSRDNVSIESYDAAAGNWFYDCEQKYLDDQLDRICRHSDDFAREISEITKQENERKCFEEKQKQEKRELDDYINNITQI